MRENVARGTRFLPARWCLCVALWMLLAPTAHCTSETLRAGDAPGLTGSTRYLFTYFQNGKPGVRMAWSSDGLKWTPINQGEPVIRIAARDPFLLKHKDGMYYITYATSPRYATIIRSADLIEWSPPWKVPVMENEPESRNAWAPELFYDDENDRVMLLWSSTIPGRFPATDGTGDNGYNHRCYYKTTRDFETWSPTKLLYDPGFNNIDATIVRNGNRYMMLLKDETLKPVKKSLRVAWADHAEGPYGPAGDPIGQSWVEGPAVIRIGSERLVYYDMYFRNRYGAMRSRDGVKWDDISGELQMPAGARHGCVVGISRDVLDTILRHWAGKL